MSKHFPWKTVLLYGSAILFGIVLGPFLAGLAGGLWTAVSQPAPAQAAEAVPAAVLEPDSPTTYICAPRYIGTFSNRIHVLCVDPAPGGIFYFATPTSDSKNAARVLSILLTARALGNKLQIYYDTTGDGSSFSCSTSNCRPINAIELTNLP